MAKKCCRCGEEKELEQFPKHIFSKDGRMGRCRLCENKRMNEYYKKRRAEYNEKMRQLGEQNG